MKRKKIALVLSGGAALGFAHIGVIKALEKYNIPIDMIVGTSMGALVGAAYCTGNSVKEMQKLATKFKSINFFDVNFNMSGVFSGKGVMRKINTILPDVKIENLDIQFASVSADLLSEKEVVFKTGSIRDAVRASLSIPGIFVPMYKDNQILVDGGILNNLPEDIAMEMGADIIISVDVLSKNKLNRKPYNVFESIIFSLNVQTKEVQKYKSCYSDILIQPDTSELMQMKFGKKTVNKAIEVGEIETEKYISQIKELIKNKVK